MQNILCFKNTQKTYMDNFDCGHTDCRKFWRDKHVYIYGILQKYKSQVVSCITFCVACMFYLLLGGASEKHFV